MRSRLLGLAAVASVAALGAACGGNPTGPSSSEGVVLDGTVIGGTVAASFHATAGSTAGAEVITVTCQENRAITETVGTDGRFTLRGLPAGGFTLEFTQSGRLVGTLSFSEVKPNQEITITVALSGTTVTLVEQKRNGIGHGDLEIEGLVQEVRLLNPDGESRFLIDGHTVVARPGQTAIREGNSARTVSDVTVGRRVHVKGTWLPAEGTTQPVLASEIKLQDDDGSALSCAAGAKAEVEGKITAKGPTSITVLQQGKGIFECEVSPGTPIRKGDTTYPFTELQVGWRVHVKGTAQGLVGGTCSVFASEVMVQQN
jgi:hypothetical protein